MPSTNIPIWPGVIRYYWDLLPVKKQESIVTLHEGNTPLLRCRNLERKINPAIRLYLKLEGLNPTCSFKDRGMTVAISKAVEEGSRAVICASTGNTSASAAAYAARAGLRAYVVVPQGNISLGKLSQAMIHGAKVIEVEGNFDTALQLVMEVTRRFAITLVNSLNPFRIEGQKTAAFEICDLLGDAPDYHFLPVGNAGNITAYWKGYKEYVEIGRLSSLPKMMGFQAAGAAPIVLGRVVEHPETIASAIRIGNPASWQGALAARDESKGVIEAISDDEILTAYKLLADCEGVLSEPASAASVAGVIKKQQEGLFRKGDVVVCTLTGHGLKDPDIAIRHSPKPFRIAPDLKLLEDFFQSEEGRSSDKLTTVRKLEP
ncbi:MAG: threonine synthase [Deltaproteobacteria bacterium RIFCSPLOWO2_12_55_13]|nr:MAG: threonine synthase [Deltaproteobacteria bacterium RIFCSPLOWO2_12_55_13]